MDIYQLRYFLAIAETRNFSRAAERVFVSQPTLSAGIKKLETELGAQLFNRSKRNTTLTEVGLRFLPRARTIIYECNAAKQEAHGNKPALRLQLGFHRILPIEQITTLLADYRKSHSAVQIALKEGTSEQLESWLDDKRIDVAISTPPTMPRKSEYERLFTTKCLLAMAASHPFAGRSSVTMQQLERQDFIHRSHCLTETEVTRTFARGGVNPHIVFRTDEDHKAQALVAAGLGFCMIPDILLSPGIKLISVDNVNISRNFGLSWHGDTDNELIRSFRLFASSHKWKPLKSELQNLEWAH
ncbi:hypothetical protein A9Q83_11005 [Alphaproteobacteria bacterium 46_93_T64]|nr:hypothetical protein A9Q83_11005 [Alphaproteobacteria bacterium 46_93_T64]